MALTVTPVYVGGTLNGPPLVGKFKTGDMVISRNGRSYICTLSGDPGTWTEVGIVAETDNRQESLVSTCQNCGEDIYRYFEDPADVWHHTQSHLQYCQGRHYPNIAVPQPYIIDELDLS